MPSFHYIHEAIAVVKALKEAGCLTSAHTTQDIITELKQGRSMRQVIEAFTARHRREDVPVQKKIPERAA